MAGAVSDAVILMAPVVCGLKVEVVVPDAPMLFVEGDI
jgi:hypothetical protein